jgi:hypothetical protein
VEDRRQLDAEMCADPANLAGKGDGEVEAEAKAIATATAAVAVR